MEQYEIGPCECCEGPCSGVGSTVDDYSTVSDKWLFMPSTAPGYGYRVNVDTGKPGAHHDFGFFFTSNQTSGLLRCKKIPLSDPIGFSISYKQKILVDRSASAGSMEAGVNHRVLLNYTYPTIPTGTTGTFGIVAEYDTAFSGWRRYVFSSPGQAQVTTIVPAAGDDIQMDIVITKDPPNNPIVDIDFLVNNTVEHSRNFTLGFDVTTDLIAAWQYTTVSRFASGSWFFTFWNQDFDIITDGLTP